MRFLTLVFTVFIGLNLPAQSTQGLVTYVTFDKPDCAVADEAGDPDINIYTNGDTLCECGVLDSARYFDGDGDWFYLFGQPVEETFTTIDFSLSFYFKPTSGSATSQALFSKKTDCNNSMAFAIRFNPASRILNVELVENASISGSISKTLPYSCWYHVVVVRKGQVTTLYVNNEELGKTNAPGSLRVNMTNSEPLTVGSSDCNLDEDFKGLMDEIRLYSRALNIDEVDDLYLAPDQILTGIKSTGVNDTTILIGGAAPIVLTPNCAIAYSWSPTTNVSVPDQPEPTLTPSESTTYLLTMTDKDDCKSYDSIRVNVVDPSTISCNDILLPSGFTPNDDGLNDQFGISNPFATGELLAFEIFDRWGNIVFQTTDRLEKWDATYKGQPVNPGVFLYKIHYRCEGNEGVVSGSVTVLR